MTLAVYSRALLRCHVFTWVQGSMRSNVSRKIRFIWIMEVTKFLKSESYTVFHFTLAAGWLRFILISEYNERRRPGLPQLTVPLRLISNCDCDARALRFSSQHNRNWKRFHRLYSVHSSVAASHAHRSRSARASYSRNWKLTLSQAENSCRLTIV
jgi:hypothetical protein